jgi:putative DNA primase/helicase
MNNVTILEIPPSFPKGWDIADKLPGGNTYETLLNSSNVPKVLSDFCLTTEELTQMDIPEREYLIDPFITVRSLNMLYAKRGLGKTWAASQMAISIASGTAFFAYNNVKKGRVLFVDGEMTLYEQKSRFLSLEYGASKDIEILPSELLYREDYPLNFHREEDQQRFIECLYDLKEAGRDFDLIIFDNLSSLLSGKDENDNTEIEGFQNFLIQLRHMGYAVLIIHHAGKSGDQRGTSRREDIMDTIMKLEEPSSDNQIDDDGAHFVFTFTKTRGKTPKPYEVDIRLVTNDAGKLTWAHRDNCHTTRADDVLKFIYDEEPVTQQVIADTLELDKSRISQLIRQLRQSGFLVGTKGLAISLSGKMRLAELWPNEYEAHVQEEIPF